MTFDEVLAALQPDAVNVVKQHVQTIETAKDGEIAKLNGTVTTLQGTITGLNEQVTTLTKSQTTNTSEEEIMKGLPVSVQKMFTEQQAIIKQMQEQQLSDLAEKRFQLVKAIPCEETKLKEVLKAASPAMLEVLQAAAVAVEKSQKASGSDASQQFSTVTADTAYAEIDKVAKQLQTTDAGLSYEQAFTKACTGHPDLYKKYMEGGK